ncbi:unnamed protein product [Rotaria magnacalcarata]
MIGNTTVGSDIDSSTRNPTGFRRMQNPTISCVSYYPPAYPKMKMTHNHFRIYKCSSCNAVKITLKDRDYLFFSRNIWIPEGARCCSDHLTGHQLSQEAIDAIKMFSIRHQEIKSSDVQLLLNTSNVHRHRKSIHWALDSQCRGEEINEPDRKSVACASSWR